MIAKNARCPGMMLPAFAMLALATLLLSTPIHAQGTGTISGRVLDEQTRQPIADVIVRIRDTELSALTSSDGRFEIVGIPVGPQVVTITHLSYGDHLRAAVIRAEAPARLQVSLAARPLQLNELVVETNSELEQRRTSTGFAMNEIRRPTIDRASQMGISLAQLLQNELSGVRVRNGASGANTCVEFRGGVSEGGMCREMAVFLDGVPVTMPSALYASMPVNQIERLEVLSPGQAGALYGTSGGWGVLLIETRRGTRPQGAARGRDELVFGFDWELEQRGYSWGRVVGGAVLGNALGLGVSMLAAERCFEVRARGILSVQTRRCNAVTTMVAGFLVLGLPATTGSFAARWGGQTDRTQGRILPGMVVGTISAASGYLVLVRGQGTDSDLATAIGASVLTLGTPLLLTLADRTFRILR